MFHFLIISQKRDQIAALRTSSSTAASTVGPSHSLVEPLQEGDNLVFAGFLIHVDAEGVDAFAVQGALVYGTVADIPVRDAEIHLGLAHNPTRQFEGPVKILELTIPLDA